MSNTDAVVVLTARGISQILSEGGSQAWRLNAGRAKKYKYVVCVQNTGPSWGSPEAKHHHAFIVGHISSITRSTDGKGQRWIININSYATIDIPGQWDGNRNPVAYKKLEDMGIEIDELDFKPMPEINESPVIEIVSNELKSLTINEAKKGLALKFGVDEEHIQITING